MYMRVLLKLSGEALSTEKETLDFDVIEQTATQLIEAARLGVQIGVVVGGGNIWRGRSSGEMNRSRADQMGMLATVINAIALQDTLLRRGAGCEVLSAVEMQRFCDTYTYRKAMRFFAQGNIVIFAAGTGHPYFSTDTTAALRAAEIAADVLLLAKNIDGVYSADPKVDPNAIKYERISSKEVIEQQLQATDLTAITLCAERNIPILAFGLKEENSIVRAVSGEHIGTLITNA